MQRENGNGDLEKFCNGCGEWLLTDFFHIKNAERGTFESECKACRRVKRVDRYYAKERGQHLEDNYGIDELTYHRLLRQQGGCCAVCGYVPLRGQHLHVDHDHTTGVVRGILCGNCNTAIGLLQNNPMVMRRAARYVVKTVDGAA